MQNEESLEIEYNRGGGFHGDDRWSLASGANVHVFVEDVIAC